MVSITYKYLLSEKQVFWSKLCTSSLVLVATTLPLVGGTCCRLDSSFSWRCLFVVSQSGEYDIMRSCSLSVSVPSSSDLPLYSTSSIAHVLYSWSSLFSFSILVSGAYSFCGGPKNQNLNHVINSKNVHVYMLYVSIQACWITENQVVKGGVKDCTIWIPSNLCLILMV